MPYRGRISPCGGVGKKNSGRNPLAPGNRCVGGRPSPQGDAPAAFFLLGGSAPRRLGRLELHLNPYFKDLIRGKPEELGGAGGVP